MSQRVRITRGVPIPDHRRIDRLARMPELGPRILFFSGGTALGPICRVLKRYTHNSVHLITPFDSGGSSAVLRAAFAMPAVGDLRNRLLALANDDALATRRLFSHRLAEDGDAAALVSALDAMIGGDHELIAACPQPLDQIIRGHLRAFRERMPPDFDLRGASIGNLLLAGGYLAHNRDLDSVVFTLSKLMGIRGRVRLIVDDDVSLFARTSDGRVIAGQHTITRRDSQDRAALVDLWLSRSRDRDDPVACTVAPSVHDIITSADLICFPVGSFFTSVLANLLPAGVGRAICEAQCPKVYVPNIGDDSEQRGISVAAAVDHIARLVRADAGQDVDIEHILNFVLVDAARGNYSIALDVDDIAARGVDVIDRPLVRDDDTARHEPEAFSHMLLSLA